MPAEMSEAELPLHRLSGASSRASLSSAAVGDGLPPTTASSLPIRTDAYADDGAETGDADADAAAALLDSSDTEKRPAGARGRARTASFSFDFSGRLLQLAASDDVGAGAAAGTAADRGTREGRGGKVKEHMSLIGGMALIVGIVIGSGIFSSPGVVARETGSGSSFAELGVMLPNNGGHQVYLAAAFGDLAAYCYSFSAVTALKPGSQAIIAIISAEYLCRIFFHTAFEADPRAAAREIPTYAVKLVAIAGLFFISALHAWSTKAGKRTQVIVTVFKVLALVLVFIGGLTHIVISKPASDFSFAESSSKPAGYALALFSALWTFDGWDAANYIARDISPGSLPLIINSSLGVIVVLFLLANVSYFLVLPFDVATGTTTIGLDFGRALAGPVGGLLFAIIVSISALGALNGTLYTSSRLIVAASEQGFLPRFFANFNERQKTPINGILLSSALSTVFICLGDFSNLTLFYGVCAWVWNFLVVIGLLVLRTFIATPIAFASTALFLIVLSCFSKPWQSLAAFAFCVAGVVPYYVHIRHNNSRKGEGIEMT
ncbi:hypothetical protein C6P46_006313 [Rhodotorula mucilaginosa]|uniref:Amino acid transporter n=1 Tax=Rhodotorula mucilaginosa TaxID=5537 RepID=A0A9P7B462_RHOMI|nr:hypothetical protein C6P46_006313 [Rhodotorula mucilaginosa]